MKIEEIKSPEFLKELNNKELRELSQDIRLFLLDNISKTGGHLSSNLGVVELTIALHKHFDFTNDRLFVDVGHQTYVHKILTGRASMFPTLRQYQGLSGFQKLSESIYDHWEAGHAGTSLSGALGDAIAKELNDDDHETVVLIGDCSIANGESFEALNHIGALQKKVIIVLNDNEMAISPATSTINKILDKIRSSNAYKETKGEINSFLKSFTAGKTIAKGLHNFKEAIKRKVIQPNYFDDLGFEYYGIVNGHNFEELALAFEYAKGKNKPIVIHVKTIKGKGYSYSEKDKKGLWHGVEKFDLETGEKLSTPVEGYVSYSEAVNNILIKLAKIDNDLLVLTPAMIVGSKLEKFFKEFPERSFDCGMAEEHAATLAAGLALAGKKPFLSIYSTFLQRAYDQINHDICRMNLPVIIGIDRSGLVGEDGDTHQGVFDIGILRPIPNLIIAQAKNYQELADLIYTASLSKQPFAIRYPRGSIKITDNIEFNRLDIGKWTSIRLGGKPEFIVLTYGAFYLEVVDRLKQENLSGIIVNTCFIKPLDEVMLLELAQLKLPIYILQDEMLIGGLSSAVSEYYTNNHLFVEIHSLGLDDCYVEQGDVSKLREAHQTDISSLIKLIKLANK